MGLLWVSCLLLVTYSGITWGSSPPPVGLPWVSSEFSIRLLLAVWFTSGSSPPPVGLPWVNSEFSIWLLLGVWFTRGSSPLPTVLPWVSFLFDCTSRQWFHLGFKSTACGSALGESCGHCYLICLFTCESAECSLFCFSFQPLQPPANSGQMQPSSAPSSRSRVSVSWICSQWHYFLIGVSGKIKRREVELDPQVSPEEIMSREVELGCESWTSFALSCSSTAAQRTLSLWLPSTAVETTVVHCISRCTMARGHRLNTSIVLVAVHGLSSLSGSIHGRAFTLASPYPHPHPLGPHP